MIHLAMHPSFHHVSFYKSVANMQDLPSNSRVEIAFAGRSNAGKSSVINTLTNRNRLAYVSKSPDEHSSSISLELLDMKKNFLLTYRAMDMLKSLKMFVKSGIVC